MAAAGGERAALIDILGPGAAFGQSGRFGGGPRLVTAIAARPAQVFHVSDAGLQAVAAREPEVWRAVSELLYGQLARLVRLTAEALSLAPGERLAARLAALERAAGGGDGWLAVSQGELAELAGLSRKAVNARLGAWRRAGLVEVRYGAVRVADPGRLAAVAGLDG
jgi:CRP/FNR family transcriptional regulator, cyclic AMP receptor protein